MSTISAIYENHKSASKAINELKTHGFNRDDLTVLTSENSSDLNIQIQNDTKTSEGIAAGAIAGGLVGTAISGLTGGLGLIAAGPIAASLAGAGAGAGAGGLLGGLMGYGMPETEAKLVEEKIGKGYVMLGMKVDDKREDEVKKVFNNNKPSNITVH